MNQIKIILVNIGKIKYNATEAAKCDNFGTKKTKKN